MNDKIITFKRVSTSADWWSSDSEASLCGGGLDRYVDIPSGINKLDAIFTEDEPTPHDFFEVTCDGNIETAEEIEFFDNAASLLRNVYNQGYRYLRVEF